MGALDFLASGTPGRALVPRGCPDQSNEAKLK